MPYISNTDKERDQMLEDIGLSRIQDLFSEIPEHLRAKSFNIQPGKSELDVMRYMKELAGKNNPDLVCFMGAGFYDHYIPSAVDAVCGRSEFYTAYTPYQPECSQGSLQSIYEYQTMICRLTEMDVSNASLYDGGTALYEAVVMAVRITNRTKIIIDQGLNPIYRKMLHSYMENLEIDEIFEVPVKDGLSDKQKIKDLIDDQTAAIVFQNPNFFGCIDDYSDIVDAAHNAGALALSSVYPISLALLKTPSEMGVDIVTGEGQSLGLGLSFGGPYLGFIATLKKYVRKIPGRLVGLTTDKQGRDGFVLTLQAREQHIRRERAISNICSNQALCAFRALVYLCLLGKQGFKDVANACHDNTQYMKLCISKLNNVNLTYSADTFNEFVVTLPKNAEQINSEMMRKGYIAGLSLGRYYEGMDNNLLISVTEKRTKQEIDGFVSELKAVLSNI